MDYRYMCGGHPFNRLCERSRPWFPTMIVGRGLTSLPEDKKPSRPAPLLKRICRAIRFLISERKTGGIGMHSYGPTLEIVNIDGETVWRHAVALSELTVPKLRR